MAVVYNQKKDAAFDTGIGVKITCKQGFKDWMDTRDYQCILKSNDETR
jgi:hypothetical protein